MSNCPLCQQRGQIWIGSPSRCGFPDGRFTPDNWNCATLNAMRQIAAKGHGLVHSEDDHAALMPHNGSFILIGWYKSRGSTSACHIVNGSEVEPLELEDAEEFLAFHKYELPD